MMKEVRDYTFAYIITKNIDSYQRIFLINICIEIYHITFVIAKSTHQNGDIPEHREKHHYSKVSNINQYFLTMLLND